MTVGELYQQAFGLPCPDGDVALVPVDTEVGKRCQRRVVSARDHVVVLARNYGHGSDVVRGVLALVDLDLQQILHG